MAVEQLEQFGNISILFALAAAVLAIISLIAVIVNLSTNNESNAATFLFMAAALCVFFGVLSSLTPIAADVYSGNAPEMPAEISGLIGG